MAVNNFSLEKVIRNGRIGLQFNSDLSRSRRVAALDANEVSGAVTGHSCYTNHESCRTQENVRNANNYLINLTGDNKITADMKPDQKYRAARAENLRIRSLGSAASPAEKAMLPNLLAYQAVMAKLAGVKSTATPPAAPADRTASAPTSTVQKTPPVVPPVLPSQSILVGGRFFASIGGVYADDKNWSHFKVGGGATFSKLGYLDLSLSLGQLKFSAGGSIVHPMPIELTISGGVRTQIYGILRGGIGVAGTILFNSYDGANTYHRPFVGGEASLELDLGKQWFLGVQGTFQLIPFPIGTYSRILLRYGANLVIAKEF